MRDLGCKLKTYGGRITRFIKKLVLKKPVQEHGDELRQPLLDVELFPYSNCT